MGSSNSKVKQAQLFNKPEKAKKTQIFKLHVAVHFGNYACALAFAYEDKVTIYNKWRGNKGTIYNKSGTPHFLTTMRTQFILNENNTLLCFGNRSKLLYSCFPSNSQKKFFEGFTMGLYETQFFEADEKKDEDVNCNTAQYVYDSKGRRIASKIALIAIFQHFQRLAKDYIPHLQRGMENIKDEEIQWIITVPAIWSGKVKNQMKNWMCEAALIDEHIIDHLVVVYESECFSLSIQKQYFKDIKKRMRNIKLNNFDDIDTELREEDEKSFKSAKKSIHFEKLDKYILIDAGGYTVDIVCHKIKENGCVEEVVYTKGNKLGSWYIDDLYLELLETIFNKQVIAYYKSKEPACFFEILANFQTAKETFYKNTGANTHRVKLPADFVSFLYYNVPRILVIGYLSRFTNDIHEMGLDIILTIIQEYISQQKNMLADKVNKSKPLKYFRQLFSNGDSKNQEDDECVCSLRLVTEKIHDDDD
eukprot:426341_1